MKKILITAFLLTILLTQSQAQKGQWVSLFDGKTTTGWHSYNKKDIKGWMAMGGSLMTHGKSGDIVSDKEYENFDLEFEFKASPKGNSGVLYKVIENPKYETVWNSGPEYQVIDDEGYPPYNDNGKMVKITDKQKTGANYDMDPPAKFVAKAPGEWNKGRILVNKNHIEHWVNGVKVVEYEYGSEAWKKKLAVSKFSKLPYATPHAKGHLALQDHGDMVSYRNIRIKEL